MCAQFTLKINDKILTDLYKIQLPFVIVEFNENVLPHKNSIVVIKDKEGNNKLEMMRFSLLPSWSKESKIKFATHNARIESITEKPTWKKPFSENHCLVPISYFVEPIYQNKLAGNMVRFFKRISTETKDVSEVVLPILTAAGIWDTWVNQQTGEIINSFSIITVPPPPFIANTGHDRSPLFLNQENFNEWLEMGSKKNKPEEMVKFLLDHQANIDFDVQIDRPLKPGWEKRA